MLLLLLSLSWHCQTCYCCYGYYDSAVVADVCCCICCEAHNVTFAAVAAAGAVGAAFLDLPPCLSVLTFPLVYCSMLSIFAPSSAGSAEFGRVVSRQGAVCQKLTCSCFDTSGDQDKGDSLALDDNLAYLFYIGSLLFIAAIMMTNWLTLLLLQTQRTGA